MRKVFFCTFRNSGVFTFPLFPFFLGSQKLFDIVDVYLLSKGVWYLFAFLCMLWLDVFWLGVLCCELWLEPNFIPCPCPCDDCWSICRICCNLCTFWSRNCMFEWEIGLDPFPFGFGPLVLYCCWLDILGLVFSLWKRVRVSVLRSSSKISNGLTIAPNTISE